MRLDNEGRFIQQKTQYLATKTPFLIDLQKFATRASNVLPMVNNFNGQGECEGWSDLFSSR